MEIQKNIPTPWEKKLKNIPDLDVGDSFLVKPDAWSIVEAILPFADKYPKIAFESELEVDGETQMIRFWRVR